MPTLYQIKFIENKFSRLELKVYNLQVVPIFTNHIGVIFWRRNQHKPNQFADWFWEQAGAELGQAQYKIG